jgi:hypothetical protein
VIFRAMRRVTKEVRRRVGWKPYPDSERIACVLCGSTEADPVGRRVSFAMRYRNVVCTDCGLVYMCPRPTADAFADFYDGLYFSLYGAAPIVDPAPTPRGIEVTAYLAATAEVEHHTGLFDIGCGGGGLLRAAARDSRLAGLKLGGCDPGWSGDLEFEEGGVPIAAYPKPVEELGSSIGDYSLFVLYDVLEHLLNPRTFLRTLHESTAPGAELFVSTNCLDNWKDIPPAGWERYYLRLSHPFTFTEKTLTAMLEAEGWRVRAWRAAPKGDQWVLAVRGAPDPRIAAPIAGHAEEVRAMIRSYKKRAGV